MSANPDLSLRGRRVVVHVSGGVAAVKVPQLITLLRGRGAEVRVAMTTSATRFISPMTLRALSGNPVASRLFPPPGRRRSPTEAEEPEQGHGMAHLELSLWAECHLVVPATANTLARLALGLADDPVSATLLSTGAPVILAPAMEQGMWRNPATQTNLATLRARGQLQVGPATGRLASGASGEGRMAEPLEILVALEGVFAATGEMGDWQVLVTSGGTREPVDPVRYLGNRSSGRMGRSLAREAARRGARVTLVTAAEDQEEMAGIELVRVETAAEMLQACLDRLPGTDLVLMAAAVADFRVQEPSPVKLHRSGQGQLALQLVANVDVLAAMLERRPEGCLMVGFAAETEDVVRRGQAKLEAKGCDMVVANPVAGEHSAMGGEMAEAVLITSGADPVELPWQTKEAIAARILDQVHLLRERLAAGRE